MIRLLQLLFLGHWHRWKIIEKAKFYGEDRADPEMASGMVYILQCETCGMVKRKTLND